MYKYTLRLFAFCSDINFMVNEVYILKLVFNKVLSVWILLMKWKIRSAFSCLLVGNASRSQRYLDHSKMYSLRNLNLAVRLNVSLELA